MRRRTNFLMPILVVSALLLFCSEKKSSTPNSPTTNEDPIAAQVHQLINAYRVSIGLPTLTLNETISRQARAHSQNMAGGVTPFSHDGFDGRVSAIAESIELQSAAENVAYNQGYDNPAQTAVDGWLESPGHKANIEGDYSLTGIGVALNTAGEYYFTQIFVKPE
jgi:uncharacterized protein YkwD